MPLFECGKCGCVENTALCHYWSSRKKKPWCSACDPKIGKWHGQFSKQTATGYVECNDGYLYRPEELEPGGYAHHRIASQGLKIVHTIAPIPAPQEGEDDA